MTEPKKRGRPTNAERAARDANSKVEGADAELVLKQAEMRAGVEAFCLGSTNINPAQEYAQRVWDGQSVSLPRAERLKRVERALEGQGLSMEGVSL